MTKKPAFLKGDVVDSLQKNLERALDIRFSKDKAWLVIQIVMYTLFSIPVQGKDLSLSGIGTFTVKMSKRLKRLVPAFMPSTSIKRHIAQGTSLLDEVWPVAKVSDSQLDFTFQEGAVVDTSGVAEQEDSESEYVPPLF